MKTNLLLLFIAAVLTSCSAENISENTIPVENQLTLRKVETYSPSKAVYDSVTEAAWATKKVQHFQGGLIVADSTYNHSNELLATSVRTYGVNTASIISYGLNSNTTLFTYDDIGRIIELSVSSSEMNYRKTMNYTADGSCTVTNYYYENEEGEVWGIYTANDDGIFYAHNSPTQNESLLFEDGKPIIYRQETADNITSLSMVYYNIPMPANRLKTATQINNITLTGLFSESVAQNCNYYLKTLENSYEYDSTFNDLNYITHSFLFTMPNQSTLETFYYYNE